MVPSTDKLESNDMSTITRVGMTNQGELYVRYDDQVGRYIKEDPRALPQNVQDACGKLLDMLTAEVEAGCTEDRLSLEESTEQAVRLGIEISVK